jgi:hypothetical protein
MGKEEEEEDQIQVSCPFCGGRSTVSVPLVVTKAKTWRDDCPACGKPRRVSVWNERGRRGFSVAPMNPGDPGG